MKILLTKTKVTEQQSQESIFQHAKTKPRHDQLKRTFS